MCWQARASFLEPLIRVVRCVAQGWSTTQTEKLLKTEDRRKTALHERRPRQPRETRRSAKDAAQKGPGLGPTTNQKQNGFHKRMPETLQFPQLKASVCGNTPVVWDPPTYVQQMLFWCGIHACPLGLTTSRSPHKSSIRYAALESSLTSTSLVPTAPAKRPNVLRPVQMFWHPNTSRRCPILLVTLRSLPLPVQQAPDQWSSTSIDECSRPALSFQCQQGFLFQEFTQRQSRALQDVFHKQKTKFDVLRSTETQFWMLRVSGRTVRMWGQLQIDIQLFRNSTDEKSLTCTASEGISFGLSRRQRWWSLGSTVIEDRTAAKLCISCRSGSTNIFGVSTSIQGSRLSVQSRVPMRYRQMRLPCACLEQKDSGHHEHILWHSIECQRAPLRETSTFPTMVR